VDLTLNFISLAALPSIASLLPCYDLRELHLLGNPCTKWNHYREYVIATLPQLQSLDGEKISEEQRQEVVAELPALQKELEKAISCQSHQENASTPTETGPKLGDLEDPIKPSTIVAGEKQRWCPEARFEDQR
jgi:protein TilB